MTTETDTKEAVARLEAKLRGWALVQIADLGDSLLIMHDQTANQMKADTALDHASAEGERWFAEKLRLTVQAFTRPDGSEGWIAINKSVQAEHESRSTTIRLAIEAAAQEMKS